MPEPKEVAQALLESLPALEESVKALKKRSWEETTEALETLDRAKMNVLLSYAINDLIWVYLKTTGVDPATHEVSAELERIKRYYGKIQAVENPAQRTRSVDKAAAHRFIAAAIPLAQRTHPATTSSTPSTSAQAQAAADARVAVGLETPDVEIGSSGDTSKAGRFRFIPRQAQKTRARAEDAWNDVNELKDDDDDGEALPVASGSKTHFDEDGEALQPEEGDDEGSVPEQAGSRAEEDQETAGDRDGDEDDSVSETAASPVAVTKPPVNVKEKKNRAKQSAEVSQVARTSASAKDKKKKKQKKKAKGKA